MMRVRRLSLFVTAVLLASSNRGRLPAAEELPRAITFEAEVSAVRIERIRRGRGGMQPQVWLHRIPSEKSPGVSGESVRCYRLARAYLVEHVATAFGIRSDRVYCPKWMVETPYEIYFELEHGGIFARDVLKRILMEKFEIKTEPYRVVMPTLVLAAVEGRATGPVSSRQSCSVVSAPVVVGPASTGEEISVRPSPNPQQPEWGGGSNPIEFYLGCEILEIVPALERKFRREVLNETGISGRFDFRLPTPANLEAVNRSLEKRNGLKLIEKDRAVDVLMVVSGRKL